MTPRLRAWSVRAAIAVGLTGSACAPAFQDARLVGPGRIEVTPHLSASGISAEGEREHIANTYGAHVIVGVHERLDVGIGYSRVQFVDEDGGGNLLGFGPRVGLITDRVAFALPLGFAFGEDADVSETFTLQPTALVTIPAGRIVDLNPSFRVVIPTCEDCGSNTLIGFNFGVGIRLNQQRVILRPEAGFLRNPGETGTVWMFGFGVSFRQ
jgi:hypothetical protein